MNGALDNQLSWHSYRTSPLRCILNFIFYYAHCNFLLLFFAYFCVLCTRTAFCYKNNSHHPHYRTLFCSIHETKFQFFIFKKQNDKIMTQENSDCMNRRPHTAPTSSICINVNKLQVLIKTGGYREQILKWGITRCEQIHSWYSLLRQSPKMKILFG